MKKKEQPKRICMVPSCGAVLKKNESGLCAGCDRVVEVANSDCWLNGWGPR